MVVTSFLAVAACSSTPTSQTSYDAARTAQNFAPSAVQDTPRGLTDKEKMNVPSAPLDTPICGSALHEQAQTGAALYSRSLTSGNSCTQNACFQPLTGTFIAQNGNNSVCR
nr:hypothetical protein [Saccharibacter sp. 17.LH.SD]